MKNLLKPSIQWLFVFVPITLALEYAGHAPPPVVFFCAAIAIIPIAKLIVEATEQIAVRTGEAVGGLLNATFGNAPELIITIVALKAGLHEMVLASLIGAILANLLLALGVSFFVGGVSYHNQEYNPAGTRMYSSMMLVAVISMAVPSAFHRLFGSEEIGRHEQLLNVGLAVVLLVTYVLYLIFMLKTHPDIFASAGGSDDHEEHGERWSVGRAVVTLIATSLLAAWMSEILVGVAEATGEALGMTSTFIGIVFLAIIGGAAESLSAITMARKNKMDLTMGIALGSCIQIALFVAPLLVLLSLVIGPGTMALNFGRTELGALLLAVLIGALVSGDGKANWYKGIQLIIVYVIIALMFYFMPEV